MKINVLYIIFILAFAPLSNELTAQFKVEGSYRYRLYSDRFTNSIDNRAAENYMRQLARIKGTLKVNSSTDFVTEVISFTQNDAASPARNIGGTGSMYYGLSSVYAQFVQPDLAFVDLLRLRVGRQQFPVGKGLSQGESYYFINNFDGARLDMKIRRFNLSLFGSITGQNVSSSGLYPDPGSDQLYIGKLTTEVFNHELLAYYIHNKLRGRFNDSYIAGGGISSSQFGNRLNYFVEGAYQNFNTIQGLPDKFGMGYMAGISYMFYDLLFFKYTKIETRYAAYQGDDAKTPEQEQFSPLYPSFYWGDRRGWVNGFLGGDYPHNGQNLEGSRIWYSRIYFVPKFHPAMRLQFQYLKIGEFVDNDNYDSMVSEFAVKLYYRLSRQLQLQLRFVKNTSNDQDRDANQNGEISWSEDRVDYNRLMFGLHVQF